MSTKRRNNKRYSFELKLGAVKRVIAGESVINVAKKLQTVIVGARVSVKFLRKDYPNHLYALRQSLSFH
ncbi:hypothetical protein [Alkalihalobacillus deserti]|uniref:hypothetical protein n=1 Tax=Alkalihalobacillus deserti TaxID=2879466 RepID=UPI001D138715|nr:hypothetical protein [Alkalihalobacillus deserti]